MTKAKAKKPWKFPFLAENNPEFKDVPLKERFGIDYDKLAELKTFHSKACYRDLQGVAIRYAAEKSFQTGTAPGTTEKTKNLKKFKKKISNLVNAYIELDDITKSMFDFNLKEISPDLPQDENFKFQFGNPKLSSVQVFELILNSCDISLSQISRNGRKPNYSNKRAAKDLIRVFNNHNIPVTCNEFGQSDTFCRTLKIIFQSCPEYQSVNYKKLASDAMKSGIPQYDPKIALITGMLRLKT